MQKNIALCGNVGPNITIHLSEGNNFRFNIKVPKIIHYKCLN